MNHIVYDFIQLINFNQVALSALNDITITINHISMLLKVLCIRLFNYHSRRNAIIHAQRYTTI